MKRSAGSGENRDDLQLVDGSRVAVIGGGPAGSFVSYFLLEMAERSGLELDVEIFEPRDFSCVAPKGCNMCGGIISETLVQNLAAEGINLPSTIVQRGIESYMLHMDIGSVRIKTPVQEKRIGAVYRGAGPRDLKASKWGSFDHHLEQLTVAKGAHVTRKRVVPVQSQLIPPAPQLPGTDTQLLADPDIGHAFFAGPFQGFTLELSAISLSPRSHYTPPSALSRL